MKRKLSIALLLLISLLIYIIQNKFATFRIYQIDLFVIYSVISVIFLKSYSAFIICLLIGLMQDSLSGNILGINALSKIDVGYISFLLINKINVNIKSISFLIFMLTCFVDFIIIYIIGNWFDIYYNMLGIKELLIKFLLTSIIGCLFLSLFKKIIKDSYLEYEEQFLM